MPSPRPTLMPLTGFGPTGWIAVAVLAALGGLALLGVDLQDAYLRALAGVLGADGLLWYLVHIQGGHSLSLRSLTFNLISLLYCAVALAVAPPVARWRWGLLALWALTHPLLLWSRLVVSPLAGLLSDTQFDFQAIAVASGIFELSSCVVLLVLTRSRAVLLVAALATVGAHAVVYVHWGSFTFPISPSTRLSLQATLVGWHAVIAASMLVWALRARAHALADDRRCPRCGYDRRGSSASVCPECGHQAAITTA